MRKWTFINAAWMVIVEAIVLAELIAVASETSAVSPVTFQPRIPQKFEVVSIRATESDPGFTAGPRGGGLPGQGGPGGGGLSMSACNFAAQLTPGRLTLRNSTVLRFITLAYGKDCESAVQAGLITGLPDWALRQKFDLQATFPNGTPEYSMKQLRNGEAPGLQAMLQNMLDERFHLRLHRSSKDSALYNLVVAQTIKMKQSDDQPSPLPPRPLPAEGLVMSVDSLIVSIDPSTGTGTITASRMPIASIVQMAPMIDGRVVVDRTGMKGLYDIPDVSFDVGLMDVGFREIWPKIIQQLGLKLESGRGPVEVLVVDQLKKPTEN